MAYVGIDLHKNASQVCIYEEEAERYVERRVRTDFDGLRRALGEHAGSRVLVEASTLRVSEGWATRGLAFYVARAE